MPDYDWKAWERRMAGHSDPLDAAIAMERAGLLTSQAAGVIAKFSVLSERVVACGYHSVSGTGWVTYCGVTYTPGRFNAMVASDMGVETPPADMVPIGSSSPVGRGWATRLRVVRAAGGSLAALALFAGAILVTLMGAAWLVTQAMGQLVMFLLSGLAAFFVSLVS